MQIPKGFGFGFCIAVSAFASAMKGENGRGAFPAPFSVASRRRMRAVMLQHDMDLPGRRAKLTCAACHLCSICLRGFSLFGTPLTAFSGPLSSACPSVLSRRPLWSGSPALRDWASLRWAVDAGEQPASPFVL